MTTPDIVRIGCGSAYADDDVQLAVNMLTDGKVQYLAMDSLAERTLSQAQLRRRGNVDIGYDERLPRIAAEVLPLALDQGVRVIGNMGAANPLAAGRLLMDAMKRYKPTGRVAVVTGDDVSEWVRRVDPLIEETGKSASTLDGEFVSANAYLGCEAVVTALADGADVVVGGRLADPSLFLAAMAHEFGWALDDWDMLGRGTAVAHLLECGVYVTGGNFADPPFATVESLDKPSMPMAAVAPDGTARIEKLPDTGGEMSARTCKLQLGYEIHDPKRYLTPDVTADFTNVSLTDVAGGVSVAGATGTARPDRLKVLVGVNQGFIGEGQVSFAGPGALDRAKLAREVVRRKVEALRDSGLVVETRYDLLGVDALHGAATPDDAPEPYEVHLRVAGRSLEQDGAARVALAVEHLQLFGPAGTAGHRRLVRPVLAMYSTYIPRMHVTQEVQFM